VDCYYVPRPHRISVDVCDDLLAAPLLGGEGVAPQLDVCGLLLEELGHVAAGSERLAAGAADHDHAHGLVGLEPREDAGKLVAHRDRHRVHPGLAIDPDGRHGPGALDSKKLAHGRTSVKWPSRSRRRSILSDAVLGISATNTKRRGRLKFAGPVGGARRSRAGPRASRDQEHLALVLAIQ